MTFSRITILSLLSISLVHCAATESDKIRDAQDCLNKATTATARTCYNKVSGVSSRGASLIRCAALFVEQGFSSPSQLQSIITSMQGSGSNPTATSMVALSFKAHGVSASDSTDVTNASDAAVQCAASGSNGLMMLASMSSMATSISQLAGGTQTAGNFITIANSNAATLATTGNNAQLLSDSYTQNCTGGNAGSYQSFCNQYSAAQTANAGGSNQAVAQYFLQHLN